VEINQMRDITGSIISVTQASGDNGGLTVSVVVQFEKKISDGRGTLGDLGIAECAPQLAANIFG
jgi:hypothetical protein